MWYNHNWTAPYSWVTIAITENIKHYRTGTQAKVSSLFQYFSFHTVMMSSSEPAYRDRPENTIDKSWTQTLNLGEATSNWLRLHSLRRCCSIQASSSSGHQWSAQSHGVTTEWPETDQGTLEILWFMIIGWMFSAVDRFVFLHSTRQQGPVSGVKLPASCGGHIDWISAGINCFKSFIGVWCIEVLCRETATSTRGCKNIARWISLASLMCDVI